MDNKNNDWRATADRLGVCRSLVFQLWSTGDLSSITIGRRRFSTDRQIDEYLARLELAAAQ